MSEPAAKALSLFENLIGRDSDPGDWHTVDQDQIDRFADATFDHQFIHVDPEKAAAHSPYGTTIAHGFLTLSLLPHLLRSVPAHDPDPYAGCAMLINYGLDRVRFTAPVKVDSRLRARRRLESVEAKGSGALQLKYIATIEIEGHARPACIAELLSRVVYE